jgi:hypothetical protein
LVLPPLVGERQLQGDLETKCLATGPLFHRALSGTLRSYDREDLPRYEASLGGLGPKVMGRSRLAMNAARVLGSRVLRHEIAGPFVTRIHVRERARSKDPEARCSTPVVAGATIRALVGYRETRIPRALHLKRRLLDEQVPAVHLDLDLVLHVTGRPV